MAFKMNRPLKMNGPLKRAGLKIGRAKNKTEESGVFYNSAMGPMKMMNPSALKQVEEEMMNMPETEEETEVGYPEVDNRHGDKKAQHIFGQEITVVGDGKYVIDTEDLGYGIGGVPDGIVEVLDPDGVLGNLEEGEFVPDEDFTFEVKDGKVIITGERQDQ